MTTPPPTPRTALRPGRQRLRPDVRVPQILDAALAAFSAHGFAATRMDDIARHCGLSKGGLYAHFRSKDEIFESLLARTLAPPDLDEVAPGAPLSPRQLAQWLVERLYGVMARPATAAVLRLLIAESDRVSHLAVLWDRNVVQPHLALLGRLLREQAGPARTGVLAREPWLALAPTVYAMVMQLLLGRLDDAGLERHKQAHVAMLCELLGAR